MALLADPDARWPKADWGSSGARCPTNLRYSFIFEFIARWVLRDGVSLSHAVSSCAACVEGGGGRGAARAGRETRTRTRVRHSQAVHSARVGTPRPHSFFFSPFIPRVAVFMYLFSSAVRRSARPAPSPGCRSRPTLRDAAVRRASCRLTRFTRRTTRHRCSGSGSRPAPRAARLAAARSRR